MTFAEFYRDLYLPRHANPVCRLLHLLGVPAVVAYAGLVGWLRQWWLLAFLPVPAYGLGWLGHLVAHNNPTFFEYPVWSFCGYWKMLRDTLTGRLHGYTPPESS